MNLKYFLRGIGVGMIITAILLGVSYQSKMSDEAIILKAKKLGMVFEDIPETPATPGPTASVDTTGIPEITAIPEMTGNPEITVEPEADGKSKVKNTSGAEHKPDVTAKPDSKKPEKTAKPKMTEFSIESGNTSVDVSKKLERLGIINDYHDFDKYLTDNGYASKLRVGTYSVAKNASYKEIVSKFVK